jgi:hypothetical protein
MTKLVALLALLVLSSAPAVHSRVIKVILFCKIFGDTGHKITNQKLRLVSQTKKYPILDQLLEFTIAVDALF